MLSEEGIDEISEGEVVCEGSGWNTPQPCIDSEFCNGVNTTCPLVGGTSVRFDFGMSTADWATFEVSQWNGTLFVFQNDDSQQNINYFLTPVFNALSHGVLCFAIHGSSNIHFLIG